MKKILIFFMIISLTFSLCAACAKKEIPGFDDEEGLDFRGGDIVVAVDEHLGKFPYPRGESASFDRELDRFDATEKEFNFNFDFLHNVNAGITFLSAALSGGMQADLLFSASGDAFDAYLVGTLLPAESFISDPTEEKWQPASEMLGIFEGKRYCVFPNYWEGSPSIIGFISANITKLEEYNVGDPHEIIEAGEWDWEHFRDFIAKTVINDGEIQWEGFIVNAMGTGSTCITPFMLANGAKYITNKDGRWTCDIASPEAKEALAYVCSLLEEGIMKEVGADYPGMTMICNYGGGGYSHDTEDKICGLRFPYGPGGSKDIVSTMIKNENVWSFPIFSAYTEDEIGSVIDYMFEPLSDIYPNGWKDFIEDQFFFNHEDFEYYLEGVKHAVYMDDSALYDSFWTIDDAIMAAMRGRQSPEVALDGAVDIIQEELNEKYNR